MPCIKKIDHIAIVVDDIEKPLAFWRDMLGLPLDHIDDVRGQEAMVAFLPIGESEVELVKPTSDLSGLGRYLKKRGPGLHHICFQVESLATLLDQLKEQGVRLINETPVTLEGGKRMAFIHPKSANGVLVELYEL
jgi:methylmalonyl-CoA/ethylmalonyl-CoA epimerase